MKRRTFLHHFLAVFAVLFGCRSALARYARLPLWRDEFREPSLQFFWVGEDSEAFVAPDLAALNAYLGAGEESKCYPCGGAGAKYKQFEGRVCDRCGGSGKVVDQELLTAANEGSEWGKCSPDQVVQDEETGKLETFAESAEFYRKLPWFREKWVTQVATCYN